MGNFTGYLYKFGSRELPLEYVAWEGVTSTPDQRTEAEAFTNSKNELIRSTYSKYRSKFEINFREGLTDTDVSQIFSVMSAGLQNAVEQKYQVTYWDDKTGNYKTGNFYMADPQFSYKKIEKNQIVHKSFKLTFIEY